MNAKHTPGPWKVDAGVTYNVRDAGTEGVVAQIHFLRGRHGLAGRIPAEQGLANANLIAAAPELLEALKKVEEALKKDSRGKTITGDSVEYHLDGQEMYHAINLARAAIARAEGGQS